MLMMKPFPTLSPAYSLLLQEESQHALPVNSTIDSMAMNVKFAGNNHKQTNQHLNKKTSEAGGEIYDFCYNTGHHQNKCLFLHGYPY